MKPETAKTNAHRIVAYKSVNELAVGKVVQYYAMCLIGGREPLWGLFDKNMRFIRLFSDKQDFIKQRPYLNWHYRMVRWNMDMFAEQDVKKRRTSINDYYGEK